MEIEQNLNTLERRLFDMAQQKQIPINGSLELLPFCNMNCDMCYVRMSKEEVDRNGRIHTAQEWLSLGNQMKDAGVMFLLLTGGEPLLHPEFKEIYLGLKKMGFVITINTNGTLINEEWADFFAQNKPRRLNITLYGSHPETYLDLCHYDGYAKTYKAIQLLRERNVDVKMSATIAKKNQKDVADLIRIAQELEVPINVDSYLQPSQRERSKPFDAQSRMTPQEAAQVNFLADKLTMRPESFAQMVLSRVEQIENTPEIDPIPSRMQCLAGKCSFTINWQGELRPCVILSKPAMSVFEHSFTECWTHVSSNLSTILLNGKCTACKYRSICHICAAAALYETGSYDGIPEYLCQYAEAFYQLLKEESKSILPATNS